MKKLYELAIETDTDVSGPRSYVVTAESAREALGELLKQKPGMNGFKYISFRERQGEVLVTGEEGW